MTNNFFKSIIIILFGLITSNVYAYEDFNFDVTEVEILENGNLYKGKKRGTITTDDGIIIDADQFEYDKKLNILNAFGNVKVNDEINNYVIFSEKIIYDKNKEIIFTTDKSKGINYNDNTEITAKDFEYNKIKNILIAKDNVVVKNVVKDYSINSNYATYLINEEKIFTEGKTSALIHSKYKIDSSDVIFLKIPMKLISDKNTTIADNSNLYNLKKFTYLINSEELRGENIIVKSNFKSPKSDKFYFSSANINLSTQNFVAKDTKIKLNKSIFDNPENDPRLYGVSSKKDGNITTVNKGLFTPCKENENCPPWSIKATKIEHNQNTKQLIYDNAILKLYDFPILYAPKFYHPDPTVRRLSGFLRPQFNSSDELGDSVHLPYFHIISSTKDVTIRPTFFESDIKMLQSEYRQQNKSSTFITDFGLTTGYKPSYANNKKSITHLFANFFADLKMENYNDSDLSISIEKVSNDTYLKVFDTNLYENNLTPADSSNLKSEIKLILNHEDYNLNTGIAAYEKLGTTYDSDRYQFILPYYDFSKYFESKFFDGGLSFSSSGSNDLNNTNELKSKINNDINIQSNQIISGIGIVNKFNIYFKNTNSIGKKSNSLKSSADIELWNINEYSAELPLKKISKNFNNFITPKISFRFNPTDMKDHSGSSRGVELSNLFSINRLGIDDSFEEGRSLTTGITYKKERLNDINKYFSVQLGSVFRDKEANFIQKNSSLDKKNSALFGSIETKLSKNANINYNFRVDNNYDRFEYNALNADLVFGNFNTTFGWVEETGDVGDANFLSNSSTYEFNDENLITFKTRRNRKINFTEYYDLIYEYKNDCLIAGLKYKKQFYSDRDLKPSESLLFSITFYPFTSYEHSETNLFK